jgi:tRNA(Ile)-lysidine synthase
VAVSGGADSTALLAGLASVASEFRIELYAAHLHHGLRGAEADADRAAVTALCESFGIPLTSARWDTKRRMARQGLSGQDGLRRLRREFLTAAARRAGASAIATSHTADDQLETLLLRLARGAGLRGLGGMREQAGPWLKPMLEVTRAEIEADLKGARLSWREDASNASPAYARNRIRHEVVPALLAAVAGPGRESSARAPGETAQARSRGSVADPAIARSGLARRAARAASEARAAEGALSIWVSRRLSRASRIEGGEIRLDSRGVAPYPSAARRIALRLLWQRLDGPRKGLTLRHLDALLRLTEPGARGAVVRLPDGWSALRERHDIRIHSERARPRSVRGGTRTR